MKKRNFASRFVVNAEKNTYRESLIAITNSASKSLRGFTEFVTEDGVLTYRVNFRLGGGYFMGWTLQQMMEDESGIDSLKWIVSKDFPGEVRKYIVKLFYSKRLITKDTMIDTIATIESEEESLSRSRKDGNYDR